MSFPGFRASLLAAALAASGATPSPARVQVTKTAPAATSGSRSRTSRALRSSQRRALPGCTDALATSLRERLVAKPQSADELEEIWRSPCLAHFARFFDVPEGLDAAELAEIWWDGLGEALQSSVGGLETRDGKRIFVVPPQPRPSLLEEDRAALAPWICGDGEKGCERSQSYRMRAEESFARTAERDRKQLERGESARSDECSTPRASRDPEETAFEAWVWCAVSHAPRVHRYARVSLRAPERGWLVLSGRRGHYSFADELRAYDLTTGAAYVVRSESDLWLQDGGGVDFGKTDAARKLEAFTGTVARDQLRELAFVLVTGRAVSSVRQSYVVSVPKGLEVELTPGETSSMGGLGFQTWTSSAQTSIAFALIEGGALRASGDFRWPDSCDPVDDHADGLIRILEAGLVPGCAPARPPKDLVSLATDRGGISRLDADPGRQLAVYRELNRAFDELSKSACPDVR